MPAGPSTWKIFLGVGIILLLIAFVLGWIGFGVPEWQAMRFRNNTVQEYHGLWAYCQEPPPTLSPICRRWEDAETQIFNGTRPTYVRTTQGLITAGMILLSLGLIAALVAAILPLIAYVAGALTLLGFLLLIIGLPIFANQSDDFWRRRGYAIFEKRFGFWLIVPTIILTFIAGILFLVAGYFYQKFGFGNFATHSYGRQPYGGQRLLGPPNALPIPPYGVPPYGPNPYYPQTAVAAPPPSLLSQYIAQRIPRYHGLPPPRPSVISAVPQPSVVRAVAPVAYTTPAYYRTPAVAQTGGYAPVVNLTGRALSGPVVRIA